MRNLIIAGLFVVLGTACSHKAKKDDAAKATPAMKGQSSSTKDVAAKGNEKAKAAGKSAKAHAKATKDEAKGEVAAATGASVKCAHSGDERTLEIQDKDGGCDLVYTKQGNASSVATSQHGKQHCEEVSAKIQAKLADAGFSCK